VEEDSIIKEIEALVALSEEENIYELEIKQGGLRIGFKRRPSKEQKGPFGQEEKDLVREEESTQRYEEIKSPLAGIFYRSPSPTEPHFVEVGDKVVEDQVVGLIEAMKVFNELKAETSGIIREILVESGQAVKRGETLMRLERT
jgi:biotin carboxyl carrier protein